MRHSASPAMQNAGIAALGLDWRYLAFAVRPEELATALAGAATMRFIGVNLTVPHKLLAVDLVDELDATAREWGAVNTVRFEAQDSHGHWLPLPALDDVPPDARVRSQGFNTDANAITRSLAEDLGVQLRGACVVLLGAGGAGRTAALKLASEGVTRLSLINRTVSKAEALQQEIHARFPGVRVEVDYPQSDVDLLLNATSLGLKPDDVSPLDEALFPIQRATAVYDMIYRPAETPLLARARAAGCRTANGLGMLLYQGARALELWSGQPAPIEPMRRALQENVYGAPDASCASATAPQKWEARPT